jgi:8-oxo-dGTP pyrophosphatase MutT (NUDIX family)
MDMDEEIFGKINNKQTADEKQETYYFIERDGKVYLVEKSGLLQFPTVADKLPFDLIEKKKMNFGNFNAIYCTPDLKKQPEHWHSRDELPEIQNLHPAVRKCLHMSFPRCVAEALLIKDGQVLLVNASRGVTKGFWNLPGGFLEYGESPEECIIREVKEEIGLIASTKDLTGVYTKASAHHPFYLIAFVFLCDVDNFDIKLDPDEIAETKWFDINDAIAVTKSHFTKVALNDYKNKAVKH